MSCLTHVQGESFKTKFEKKYALKILSLPPINMSETFSTISADSLNRKLKQIVSHNTINQLKDLKAGEYKFVDITYLYSDGNKHAVCLYVYKQGNTYNVEFFDANGVLNASKYRADYNIMAIINYIRGHFKKGTFKLHEMNKIHLNKKGHCNAWVLYYYYTRINVESTQKMKNVVGTWTESKISEINALIKSYKPK